MFAGSRGAGQVDLGMIYRGTGMQSRWILQECRCAEEAGLGSAAIAPRSPDILFLCQERGNK